MRAFWKISFWKSFMWKSVRRASIPDKVRSELEQYGVAVIQQKLARNGFDWYRPEMEASGRIYHEAALAWLTEQHDVTERREHLVLAVEVLVAVLVAAELFVGFGGLIFTGYEFYKQNQQFDRQVRHQDDQFKTQKAILDTQLDVLRSLLKSSQQSSDILDADEKRRSDEAKTVPIMKLTSGGDSLPPHLHGTGTGAGRRFDFVLKNTGTADATGIRIIVSGGFEIADIICNDGSFQVMPAPIGEAEQVGIRKRIAIPDTLGKKVGKIGLSLTFTSRPGLQSPLGAPVHFEVITDQHPVPTDLGSTTVTLLV